MGHEEDGEDGLDLDRGLWAGERGAVVHGEWLADVDVIAAEHCVSEPEEV